MMERKCKGIFFDPFSNHKENGKPIWQPVEITDNIVCDGHLPNRDIAIFTHFHTDHAWNINRAISNSTILMTQITYDALKALLNLPERSNYEIIRYGRNYVTPYEEKIELINANHIPGSAQVFVEEKETGFKTLYSGDFAYPGIQIPKTDCLILDSTHGEDIFDFETNRKEVMEKTFEDVLNSIENNRPIEIVANRGTMQEFVHGFEQSLDGRIIPEHVPFVMDGLEKKLTESILNHFRESENPHEIYEASDSLLNDLYLKKQPYIYFSRINKRPKQSDRHDSFIVDSWNGFSKNGNYVRISEKLVRVNYQAHSGFRQILKYVEETGASQIIIDGSRGNEETASKLANSISQLGKNCFVSKFKI